METKKIWGFILIGCAVLFGLSGMGSIYAAFAYSDQMAGLSNIYGSGSSAAAMINNAAPSKIPGFVMLIIAGAGGFYGNKMLKELGQQNA